MSEARALAGSVLAVVLAMSAGGCQRGNAKDGRIAVSVFAASSLTEAFTDLEAQFEGANPAIDVQLTMAGSQVLRLQIEQGAAADVFASANEGHMEALTAGGLVQDARTFAHNELVIIVPSDNPAGLRTFDDLPRAERLVVGAGNVPVGRYARQMLDRARQQRGAAFAELVDDHVVSQESNVRLVRAKVELGEADAAIVYRTDAAASQGVTSIEIPTDLNVQARYPIGRTARSENPEAAERFIAFVDSEPARQTLQRHGFTIEVR